MIGPRSSTGSSAAVKAWLCLAPERALAAGGAKVTHPRGLTARGNQVAPAVDLNGDDGHGELGAGSAAGGDERGRAAEAAQDREPVEQIALEDPGLEVGHRWNRSTRVACSYVNCARPLPMAGLHCRDGGGLACDGFEPAPAGRNNLPRLDSLTGLRFFAAWLVLQHHFTNFGMIPGLARFTGFGTTGVTFFFVLSGFVLTWSFVPSDTPGRFYWRRVRPHLAAARGDHVACTAGLLFVARHPL